MCNGVYNNTAAWRPNTVFTGCEAMIRFLYAPPPRAVKKAIIPPWHTIGLLISFSVTRHTIQKLCCIILIKYFVRFTWKALDLILHFLFPSRKYKCVWSRRCSKFCVWLSSRVQMLSPTNFSVSFYLLRHVSAANYSHLQGATILKTRAMQASHLTVQTES